jgi:hypothetical protein
VSPAVQGEHSTGGTSVSSSLWRLVTVVVIGVVLGLPGAVGAHEGGSYTAFATFTAPTVDGALDEPEWDVSSYSVSFPELGTGTVRFLRQADDLYIGVVIKDATPGTNPSFAAYFDDDHDGARSFGEDAWLAGTGPSTGEDFHYQPEG